MSKKKSGGAKALQGTRVSGKRLGVKVSHGQSVDSGMILVRQRGTKVQAGDNVRVGRDHTIYAIKAGVVSFGKRLGRTKVSVAVQ